LGPANVLQYLFAQNVGFTCFGKRDELLGDCFFDAVVKEWSDWHGAAPLSGGVSIRLFFASM
jgi:hypothetical protein